MYIMTKDGWKPLHPPLTPTPPFVPWWNFIKAKEYDDMFRLPDGRDLRNHPYKEWHALING